ncbi:MAG TPA: AAA family ATPase [Mesorhizobium sp.]|jgi:predicted ABC-type ATPase|nr:AAA family ATPase [Mesorhizobium sp.]
MPNGPKRFWLIAGPNGVGKTTYAFKNVPAVSGSAHFVNLDEIARGLSPLDPKLAEAAAARTALIRAREFIARGDVFTMETTLSGQAHLALMREARAHGLSPALLYFSARSPDICLERIARRVAEGERGALSHFDEDCLNGAHSAVAEFVRALPIRLRA